MASEQHPDMPEDVRERASVLLEGLARLASGAEVHEVADAVDRAYEAVYDAARAAGEARRGDRSKIIERLVSFGDIIADHLRSRRAWAGWTQTQLAQAMARLGFDWKRQTVAEVELGTRRVSLEELLGMAALFSESLPSLIRPGDGDRLRFPDDRALDPRDVRALLDATEATGPLWPPAARVARVRGPGTDSDWRPGRDLWRQRRAGSRTAGRPGDDRAGEGS